MNAPRFAAPALAVLLLGPAGCETVPSTTGGIRLELHVSGPQNLAVLYRVEPDGTIAYGGGPDARARRTTWTGRMTDQEIAELRSLLERHGWLDRKPASTGEPRALVSRIEVKGPGGFHRYTVRGESTDVEPVQEFLDRVARRRLDEVLDSLPRPPPSEP